MSKEKSVPIPQNEAKRLDALMKYHIMDTEETSSFDRLTQLASEICETPISLVSLVDGERQWFKSRVGLDAKETPREISFCQHAIMDINTFEVKNAQQDKRFSDNVLVTGDPNIRFYAGHPLTDKDGFNLGTLCVIDSEPKELNPFQKRALKLLAEEVVSQIENHKAQRERDTYEKFFDFSLDYLCIAGTDGFFKKINPTFSIELGYTEEELLAKPFVDFIHPDDLESTMFEVHKLSKGYKTVGFVNRYFKKDGSLVYLHWTCQPDAITGELFAVAHDISKLKEAEALLKASNEELDQFAYIVSHDLKAPLRAISTLATFLEEDLEGKLDGETQDNFNLLKSRVSRMEKLINGILEYSRVGRKTANIEEVDTGAILDELKDTLSHHKNFDILVQENMPTVKFTKVHLEQVFQNIISNAIKYHDKDTGTIEVKWRDTGAMYEFSIQDDGPGIDPQFHEKIFGVFQTLQSKDEIESTGIGLSIVKKIIEENEGEISLQSSIGTGSTFIFTVKK